MREWYYKFGCIYENSSNNKSRSRKREGDKILFEIEGDEVRIKKVKDFLSLAGILKGDAPSPKELRNKVEEEIARDAL